MSMPRGSNVCGYQGADLAALETCQCLGAGALALVAVQCHRAHAILGEELSPLLAPNLVRVNTSTWLQLCCWMMCNSTCFFLPRPTG